MNVPVDEQDQGASDRRLARHIAALMRIGTLAGAILLAGGAIMGFTQVSNATTTLLIGGCGLLILLPVVRLIMMVGHYARWGDKRFALVALAVLCLVVAGGVLGVQHG